MSLWLVRAGKNGEFEEKFLEDQRIYLTWENLSDDLSKMNSQMELRKLLSSTYEDCGPNTIINWSSQIWPFAKKMEKGDWVVLPSKKKPVLYFAEIKGNYVNVPNATDSFYHYRDVKWIANDILRSSIDQDLLYSFGAFLTICKITRNNAEERIKRLAQNGWKTTSLKPEKKADKEETEAIETEITDIEELSRDQIAKFIGRKFKGHNLTRLVETILISQGFATYRSPEGPDGGVDILASPGTLGFGHPRICVQVKSQESPVDLPTLNQLVGTMQNVGAEQGLLVCWGGFKSSIEKVTSTQFFKVRLWDQTKLIQELIAIYDKLDEDIKAELPLKRVWTLATEFRE